MVSTERVPVADLGWSKGQTNTVCGCTIGEIKARLWPVLQGHIEDGGRAAGQPGFSPKLEKSLKNSGCLVDYIYTTIERLIFILK